MLKLLDFRTLLFSASLAAGAFALLMFGTMRTRKTYPGYGHWASAEVAFAVLYTIQAMRGLTSSALTCVVGNIAACCAMMLLAKGFHKFCGESRSNIWVYAASTLFIGGTFYFFFITENLAVRTILFAAYLAGMAGYAALPMLRRAPTGRQVGYCFSAAVLLFGALNGILWLFALAKTANVTTIFSRTPSNAVFYLTDLIFAIGISFSFFLLPNERYIAELRDADVAINKSHQELAVAHEQSQLLAVELQQKVEELQLALQKVQTMENLLPVCAWCKRLRTPDSRWIALQQFHEDYGSLTHGICPDCKRNLE